MIAEKTLTTGNTKELTPPIIVREPALEEAIALETAEKILNRTIKERSINGQTYYEFVLVDHQERVNLLRGYIIMTFPELNFDDPKNEIALENTVISLYDKVRRLLRSELKEEKIRKKENNSTNGSQTA